MQSLDGNHLKVKAVLCSTICRNYYRLNIFAVSSDPIILIPRLLNHEYNLFSEISQTLLEHQANTPHPYLRESCLLTHTHVGQHQPTCLCKHMNACGNEYFVKQFILFLPHQGAVCREATCCRRGRQTPAGPMCFFNMARRLI